MINSINILYANQLHVEKQTSCMMRLKTPKAFCTKAAITEGDTNRALTCPKVVLYLSRPDLYTKLSIKKLQAFVQ